MQPAFSITSSSETVVVSDVKAHLNVETTDDDTLIGLYRTAAREAAEAETKLDLIPKTVVMYLNDFPAGSTPIELLDHAPMRTITSIVYLDSDGTAQTLSTGDYKIDIYSEPPRIYPDYSTSWPSVYPYTASYSNVTVTYGSGYTTATIPSQAVEAIKLMVGSMYENREESVVGTVTQEVKMTPTVKWLLAQIAAPVV